ncbi:hypothetical protein EW146_g6267 [Bondarzewia mesenterica]|uniref:Uncharacterized protein n=1 Tax=Bondarzewia mesenterica TaxID=1095465 RepID=A0A4S4LQ21_9AGAM|nr:hypothetical protein EW146_g6267 [Bondarzewia mesenterica]
MIFTGSLTRILSPAKNAAYASTWRLGSSEAPKIVRGAVITNYRTFRQPCHAKIQERDESRGTGPRHMRMESGSDLWMLSLGAKPSTGAAVPTPANSIEDLETEKSQANIWRA